MGDFFSRLRKWCEIVEAHTDREFMRESDEETNDVVSEFLCESLTASEQSFGDVDDFFTERLEHLGPFVSRKENVLAGIRWMRKLNGCTGSVPQRILHSFVWQAAKLVATSH